MNYVSPSGPVPCQIAIVGEAPGSEELRQGRGFVGPSGRLLWPVLYELVGIQRPDCYVTNLCKHTLDDEADVKLEPEEFEALKDALIYELLQVHPESILAVGALASKALLGNRYVKMEVHNGMTYFMPEGNWNVTPCWHPAAALRGSAEGKDPLAWMGDAISHFIKNPRYPERCPFIPPWRYSGEPDADVISIDTEGTTSDPICVTWSDGKGRYLVPIGGLDAFWKNVRKRVTKICYQNAPWDWAVLEAMGVVEPWRVPFVDTMELAYLKQTEPQGLKDLGLRWLGVPMKSWEEIVMPYYNEAVIFCAAGKIDAGTTTTTHSPKTGKVYKKPKIERTEEAKKLARLTDPKKIAERLEFEAPTLRHVPFDVMVEYATLDPWVTMGVWEALR